LAVSDWLDRAPDLEEVKRAVWDCDSSKAPEPDGYTFAFYKKTRHLLSKEIFLMVTEFFRNCNLLKGIISSFVALIPKNKNPASISEYRPISPIHGLYKIVAKLLSSRLRIVMSDITSVNQSAFIAGRQILYGFMIENEVVHGIKKEVATVSCLRWILTRLLTPSRGSTLMKLWVTWVLVAIEGV
jgi:hypothetical protein